MKIAEGFRTRPNDLGWCQLRPRGVEPHEQRHYQEVIMSKDHDKGTVAGGGREKGGN